MAGEERLTVAEHGLLLVIQGVIVVIVLGMFAVMAVGGYYGFRAASIVAKPIRHAIESPEPFDLEQALQTWGTQAKGGLACFGHGGAKGELSFDRWLCEDGHVRGKVKVP